MIREGAVQHLPFNAVNFGFILKGEVKEGRNHATVFFLRRINGGLVYYGNRPVILELFHGGPNFAIKSSARREFRRNETVMTDRKRPARM
jgi:hypothetical protein